jgi:hypothetical protein
MLCIINTSIPGYEICFKTLIGKSNIDQARSMMATTWYDEAAEDDLFLFLDADQTFASQDIISLINLKSEIAVGIYPSMGKYPCCRPFNFEKFSTGEDDRLFYGATGFMLIRKSIMHRVLKLIEDENFGISRFHVSQEHPNVIPFFKQRLIKSETLEGKNEWLGEDYSFCWAARKVGCVIRSHMSPTIGHEVTQHLTYYPDNYKVKTWEKDTIVYFAGFSRLMWSATDPETKGLGGAETAIIRLSEYWASKGKKVFVYGNVQEGVFNGVNYLNFEKFSLRDIYNVLILWRSYGIQALPFVRAEQIIVDMHDLYGLHYNIVNEFSSKVNKIMVKSNFHRDNMQLNGKEKFTVIENGTPGGVSVTAEEKWNHRYKLIYASSYDRGLLEILKYSFPLMKRIEKDIELHIYYGDELLDETLKQEIGKYITQDGIFHHGKVSQKELLKIKEQMGFHYYLATHGETDCISIKESAIRGCIPVLSTLGAFGDLDRNYMIKVPGNPTSFETHQIAVDIVIGLIRDKEKYIQVVDTILSKSKDIPSWDVVGEKWMKEFF